MDQPHDVARPLRQTSILSAAAAAAMMLSACAAPASDVASTAPVAGKESAAVRAELERAYELNRQALLSRNAAAVLALRTPDFHVVTPDGATHDAREMADFTHNLVNNVQEWVALDFKVGPIEQRGNELSADIGQHSIRKQLRDGAVRRIENWVTQRETWVRTPQGLRMRRVENIRDQRVLIDGVPRQ